MHWRIDKFLKRIPGFTKKKSLKKRDALRDLCKIDRELVSCVKQNNLTYLSDRKLASIITTCREIESANLAGVFVEAGCALGGSSIVIASVKKPDRPFLVYDVFGMIPPPSDKDTPDVHERYLTISKGESMGLGGDKYYGYIEDLYGVVKNNLKAFGIDREAESVTLIKGLLQNTMQIDQDVCFAHIDVDWYDPVKTCLQRLYPKLLVGGTIILDDYLDWGGCRKAVDEFFLTVGGRYEFDHSAGSLKVTKLSK